VNRALVVEHVTVFKDVKTSSVNTLASYLFSRGLGMPGSKEKALKVLDGIVKQQSGMLTYNHIFFLSQYCFSSQYLWC
jgi:hypothetical protein